MTLSRDYIENDRVPITNITSTTTLYVATTGSDTTGDGTSGNPWATPNKAIDYLDDKKIKHDVIVTISIASGAYTGLSELVIKHPNSNCIHIIGAGKATTSLTFAAEGITIDGVSLGDIGGFELIVGLMYTAFLVQNNARIYCSTAMRVFSNEIGVAIRESRAYFDTGMLESEARFPIEAYDFSTVRATGANLIIAEYSNAVAVNCFDNSEVQINNGTVTDAAAAVFTMVAQNNSFINASGATIDTSWDNLPAETTGHTPSYANIGSWIYLP